MSLGNLGQGNDPNQNGPSASWISYDGSVIAGVTPGPLWPSGVGAFRWSRETGMVALSDSYAFFPLVMSVDGSTIYWEGATVTADITQMKADTWVWSEGNGVATVGWRVFAPTTGRMPMSSDNAIYGGGEGLSRWSWETGFEDIASFRDAIVGRLAVSADGSVVAGTASGGAVQRQAFRWAENEGLTYLATTDDYNEYRPQGVSANGSVIAGVGRTASFTPGGGVGPWGLWRWTDELGMVLLQEGTSEMEFIEYGRLSADGAVVVMNTHAPDSPWNWGRVNTVRWTEETGLEVLQPLPGFSGTTMTDVSLDGSRIVGTSFSENQQESWLWTEETGMLSIRDFLKHKTLARALTDGRVFSRHFNAIIRYL